MTVTGVGTIYYGWKANSDGSVEATCWFVLAFLPLIPLRRERIRVMPPLGRHFAPKATERLPLDWRSVVKTYFYGYTVVPIVLFAPIVLMILSVYAVFDFVGVPAPEYVKGIFAAAAILYFAVVIAYILDGAAGKHLQRQSSNEV